MKTLAYILILLFLTTQNSQLLACAQIRDNLVYKNDTLSIRDFPLEQLYNNFHKKPDFFENSKTKRKPESTGCWRGYQADWIIVDNQLYLTSINSCCEGDNVKSANLKKLFGNKFINGKVKADWFSGSIIAEIGKPIIYLNFSDFIFPFEQEFDLNQGNLIETKYYDNTKSKQSEYFINFDKFEEYIYKNINWKTLPKLAGKEIRVRVKFSSNENGIIDSVFVDKRNNNIFDDEAIRVIKLIPEWNIYLREGKELRIEYQRTITFNQKNKEKYYRQNK